MSVCVCVRSTSNTMMFFVCFTNSIIWNLTNQFMPEAIQTKHLPSSKTYVRDAIKYVCSTMYKVDIIYFEIIMLIKNESSDYKIL